MPKLLADLQTRLKATNVRVEMTFPIFLERAAPITKSKALLDFDCHLIGQMKGREMSVVLGVDVPVTSLCPCSKEISKWGAHNQRGHVSILARPAINSQGEVYQIWLEDLIDVAETTGSSPVYPLLKREDEKYVTEQAYENPAFCEDMVRSAAVRLQDDPRIAAYTVHVENMESIHNHAAFAERKWARPAEVA
jgi:GTP cyclohydrolase I